MIAAFSGRNPSFESAKGGFWRLTNFTRRRGALVTDRVDPAAGLRVVRFARWKIIGQMSRSLRIVVILMAACLCGRAEGHDEHEHGMNPLACDVASGEICYYAVVDDFHATNSPHPDAIGEAFFVLNAERTELRYLLTVDGLSLKPIATDRTEPDDIIGIHLHLNVPDTVGPHVLNIFGLATYGVAAEEDADLVVDYDHKTLSGIYDISDATIDPATGEPYFQFFPLTSKIIDDWLDELDAGQLMIAVHTVASGFPAMAIHGHISRSVPEPTTSVLTLAGIMVSWLAARKRRSAGPVAN
jgi:hypothetical protein